MTEPAKNDQLKPILQEAEDELSRRLHDACAAEAGGVATKTSAEIREIEDSLLAAAVAAGEAISLRRHIAQDQAKEQEKEKAHQSPPPSDSADARETTLLADLDDAREQLGEHTVREFRDSRGEQWRAWPVIPGLSRTGRPKHYLGEFQRGWICFESLDRPARRRLPCAPARLAETKDEELERLLLEAIASPERKGATKPH
ncbi:MAG: hypothetical protein ACJ79K_13395 [Gemmatimonadaceae bacterium]